jgi:hypothetical protein
MLRVSLVLITGVLATAISTAVANFSVVRLDGIGPARVGMTLSELNRVLHTTYPTPTDPDERSCFYIDVPRQSGTAMMILDGRLARVDVDNTTTKTVRGIGNGDSEAHALQVYGKELQVEPHHYIPENGHYLTLFSPDRKFAIRFETEDGKITRYYAGTAQAISYVEGCS